MPSPTTARNRHIVDQLADVRAEIKALQETEKVLKAAISKMMGSSDTLGGDQYVAIQKTQERKGSLDAEKITAAGLDPEQFRKPATVAFILHVEPRVAEVA